MAVNIALQSRIRTYLDVLQPHVRALREAGFPVEVTVTHEDDGRTVVAAHVDVNDTRVPVESVEA